MIKKNMVALRLSETEIQVLGKILDSQNKYGKYLYHTQPEIFREGLWALWEKLKSDGNVTTGS